MEFSRRGPLGAETPYVTEQGITYELTRITTDIDAHFLSSGGIESVRAALRAGDLTAVELDPSLRWGAPLARPQAVICVGQNYAAHAAESGDIPPTRPIIFFKHPNTVVGPYDDVLIPPGATKVDWEVELGVIIGARARYLGDDAAAWDCVAGYVVSHDVSEREYQLEHSGGQWSKGKSSETFNPLGPVFVPASDVDGQNLRLWSTVNGEPRQDSNTADMIFGIAELIRTLSQYMVLEAGDLINTGTPQGVAVSGRFPYLSTGDVVELGIEGLGTQRQRLHGSVSPL